MRLLLTTALLATVVLSGCDFSEKKDGNDSNGPGQSLTEPTYSTLQAQLFDGYCTKCHGGAKQAGGIDLSSFDALSHGQNDEGKALLVPGNASASKVYTIIAAQAMPPAGNAKPDSSMVSLLKDWIDGGATEDLRLTGEQQPNPGPAPAPPTHGEATFTSLQETLFKPMCVSCHNSEIAKHGVRVDAYDEMMKSGGDKPAIIPGDPDGSKLMQEVLSGKMPPKRTGLVVSQELKDNLHDWIAKGAPRE